MRVRDWGIQIGDLEPGLHNAISDVKGVRVGYSHICKGEGSLVPGHGPVRTGVSAVWPCQGNLFQEKVPAAVHVINGFTKCTGLIQIQELGSLETPILITNTLNVGKCTDALIEYLYFECGWKFSSINCSVTECNDSFLNDILGRHIEKIHVFEALSHAHSGPIEEGNVGAGTGMSCYELKGGMGTASRRLNLGGKDYYLGVLVCTNMGVLSAFRVNGIQVGPSLRGVVPESGSDLTVEKGSIIILIATNIPLEVSQLARLAKRSTHGLARTGTTSNSTSGDVAIAWTSAWRIDTKNKEAVTNMKRLQDGALDVMFAAVADCTEESILNAIWQAESMVGRDGNFRMKVPLHHVYEILSEHNYRFSHRSNT
jgi:D-aminopeptidase